MPMTCYCKKCGRDVPVADTCAHCGAKLARSSARVAWCVEHAPVRDWMCWNAVMRILLPVAAMALLLTLLLEGLIGGAEGVETLLRSGLTQALALLLVTVTAAVLLIFILQGEDWLDCVVDSKGIHVSCYLPNPTPLKLALRLRSPRLMQQADPADEVPTVLLSQQDLAWKDVARVQLWPEKTLILFYAPAWWMRLALPCTPFTYEDSMAFIRDKLGRKKTVRLPGELTAPPKPKEPRPARKEQQLSFADVTPAPEPAPAAEPVPDPQAEQPEDFVPLADVLAEIKAAEDQPQEE